MAAHLVAHSVAHSERPMAAYSACCEVAGSVAEMAASSDDSMAALKDWLMADR